MPQEPGSTAKLCGICGRDCSSKPRIKDAQGRYFCRECVEKKQRAKGAAPAASATPAGARPPTGKPQAAAPADQQSLMARLVDESVGSAAGRCPGCGRPLKPDAVICTQCGFHRAAGQVITTQVQKPAADTSREKSSGGDSALKSPAAVSLISLVVLGGLLAGAMSNGQLLLPYFLVQSAFGLGVGIYLLIRAFSDSIGQGFLCLCLPFYALYFVYGRCQDGYLKGLFSVWLLCGIAFFFALADQLRALAGR